MGLKVALVARRKTKLKEIVDRIEENGGSATDCACDITKKTEVDRAFDLVKQKWGRIDLVINNAGAGWMGDMVSVDFEQVEKTIDTNFNGFTFVFNSAF